MSETIQAIPPPEWVQEKLAANRREANILRSLLKLSVQAEQERRRRPVIDPQDQRQEGVRRGA